MTSSEHLQLPDAHRLHDRLLVARAVGEDVDDLDQAAAAALFEACPDCRALAAQLRALRSTAASLPAARRPRDFRLSAAQAERLRGGMLRRLLEPLAGPTFGILQPLAGAVVAIGLGLLVVTSIPGGASGGAAPQFAAPGAGQPAAASPGGSAAAGGAESAPVAGTPIPSPAPVRGPVESPATDTFGGPATPRAPAASASGKAAGPSGERVSAQGGPEDGNGTIASRDRSTEPATDWRVVGLVLAALGFAFLVARGYARRYAEDPLLK
jgi:hypothetical protein